MLDLQNIDCMELMAKYPDGYFDLAIVDLALGREDERKVMGRKDPTKIALTQAGLTDGEDIINEIRKKYPGLPILCETGFGSYRPRNATHTVSKALSSEDLEKEIKLLK